MHSLLALAGLTALAAAHGLIDGITIDGTLYPAFDPRLDFDFPGIKRITWTGPKASNLNGTGPIEDVASPDIACRNGPLIPPAIYAVARAGSNMSIQWTPWFISHKGPVLTYMGLMPDDNVKVQDVDFFKIDESSYDPKTHVWGTDQLMKDNNTRTVTIPSDIKPGMYIVRHEIIALHFAWRENKEKKTSGAQFYPTCFKVQVTGTGTSTPPGQKFPGAYNWRDPGILYNTKYGPNKYDAPGPAVYKGERNPPQGPVPVVKETGVLSGEQGQLYAETKSERGKKLLGSVEADVTGRRFGTGGCHWEVGQDPSTMVCAPINDGNPAYLGYAQPVGSPLYTDNPGSAMRGSKPPPASFGNELPVKFLA